MVSLKEHFKPLLDKKAWWTFMVWFGINAAISVGFTFAWIMTGAFNDALNLFLQGWICAIISSILWIGLMYGTVGKKEKE
jgi:magnesium-transporting ATPase (P-type)